MWVAEEMTEDHSERIAVLETKLDGMQKTLSDIDDKLDKIGHRQMEIDLTAKVAYNTGKLLLAATTTMIGWLNWDQIVAWVHQMTGHR